MFVYFTLTMTLYLLFIILCKVFLFTGGAQDFRRDYTFYNDLNGWLKVHILHYDWQEAMLTCQLEGAVLASPTERKLLQAMIYLAITNFTTEKSIYTGIHSTLAKGHFFSLDGIPLSRIPVKWAPDEPNNVGGNENCLILHTNGTMADVECKNVHPFICFKKRTEGMPPVNECGTIDREYIYSNITRTCHKFHPVSKTWERSFKTCSAEGGYLAIANSPAEAKIFNTMHLDKLSTNDVKLKYTFLGFKFSHDLGIWLTNQGQSIKEAGYDYWSPGNPNNEGNSEYCGSFFADPENFGLNDAWCDGWLPFICEKEPTW